MIKPETLLELYETMYKIRYCNERLREEYEAESNIPSGLHGSKGQEAPAAGVCHHLSENDWCLLLTEVII